MHVKRRVWRLTFKEPGDVLKGAPKIIVSAQSGLKMTWNGPTQTAISALYHSTHGLAVLIDSHNNILNNSSYAKNRRHNIVHHVTN